MLATFSLRNKLILMICLPLLAVYLAVLVIEYRAAKSQAVAETQRLLVELTGRLAEDIDKDLATVAQAVRTTADFFTQFPPKDRNQVEGLLRSVVTAQETAFGSCAAFEPGAFAPDQQRFAPYLCRGPAGADLKRLDIEYDYPRWDWYLLPKLLGRPAWTDPYFDEGGGNVLMCSYAAPFYRDRQFAGVITVDVPLENMQARMAGVDTRGGYCTLVSSTGTFVSHPVSDYIMAESIFSLAMWHRLPELEEVGREMVAGRTGVHRIVQVATGQPAWIVFVPVESVGWSLAAVLPEHAIMADVYARLNRQAALYLVGLAVILVLILVVSTWLVRPIRRLAAVAGEVARGNLDVRVTGVHSRDEIGCFADTFNHMVEELQGNVEARIRETAAREALQREVEIARQIQVSLLPTGRPAFPGRTEFSLDAVNEPAKIMAGDFYDFWFIDDDLLALAIADVCGKGVPAAMFMAVARTVLRDYSIPGRGPAEVLAMANRTMAAQNEETMFVTVFCAHYRVRTGELVFANGGHNPPCVLRSDGRIEFLAPPTGPIVAIEPESEYTERRTILDPDEVLLLYTDGATEAANEQGDMLGESGLEQILREVRASPVEDICQTVLRRIDEYRSSPDQDDVTVLALRRTKR